MISPTCCGTCTSPRTTPKSVTPKTCSSAEWAAVVRRRFLGVSGVPETEYEPERDALILRSAGRPDGRQAEHHRQDDGTAE